MLRLTPTRLVLSVLGAGILCAPATAGASGGAAYASGADAGGVTYGQPLAGPSAPTIARFAVTPSSVIAGKLPLISVRVDSRGDGKLRARVVFTPTSTSEGHLLEVSLGAIAPRKLVHAKWPKGATLATGHYIVRLHATDGAGRALRRTRKRTGRVSLFVTAPPKPAPVAPTPNPLAPITLAPPPTGGTFPVAGAHSYGDGFGVQRTGHTHEGVDVLAAEGTPVVAPVAGIVRFTDNQPSAAGYYVVEYAADGRAFFFAHCQKDSFGAKPDQAIVEGAQVCLLGHTGDASGPHLHFELWPSGWRDLKGTAPVDPAPQLHAWDR